MGFKIDNDTPPLSPNLHLNLHIKMPKHKSAEHSPGVPEGEAGRAGEDGRAEQVPP